MFWTSFNTWYYTAVQKIFSDKKTIPLLAIDFQKAWWRVLLKRKFAWTFLLLITTAVNVFSTLIPFMVSWIIYKQSIFIAWVGIVIWLLIELCKYASYYAQNYLSEQIEYSVLCQAYEVLFSVDPVYHMGKSTGRMFGKIQRAVLSFKDFILYFVYDIFPTLIGVATVSSSFFIINTQMGIVAFTLLVSLIIANILGVTFNAYVMQPPKLQAQDSVNALTAEGISQIPLIRASFATNEWLEQIKKMGNLHAIRSIFAVIGYFFITGFLHLLYIISIGIITSQIINLITSNAISPAQGISFIITYINGTWEISKIGWKTQKSSQAIMAISDLYTFIRTFGKQTFPVLTTDQASCHITESLPIEQLSLKAENIWFFYEPQSPLFEGHNLYLSAPRTSSNKLYGIIGPSGIGKTTLVSILGGQIKPTNGTVSINNISIYDINDNARRYLIALQGQVAATFSGTVKHNLLLGIFDHQNRPYDDTFLITLLEKVGLWRLFSEKDGLHTALGEGGISLSVGQRQRLNFAALYLRAQCFKPSVILIDEPTSSLDTISEYAITAMMEELAQHAITLVIAHRITTLDHAIGILDCSLISAEKNLIFYDKNELLERSPYYRKLISGETSIEE